MSGSSNGASQGSAPRDGVPLDDPRSLLRVYPFATYTPTARGKLTFILVKLIEADAHSCRTLLASYQNIPERTWAFSSIPSTQ